MKRTSWLAAAAILWLTAPSLATASSGSHAVLAPGAEATFKKLTDRASHGELGPEVKEARVRVGTATVRIELVHKDGTEQGFLLMAPREAHRHFSMVADPGESEGDTRRLAAALDELFPTAPWELGEERTPTASAPEHGNEADLRSFFGRVADCWGNETVHCVVVGVLEPSITQQAGRGYAAFAIGLICLVVFGGLILLWTAKPLPVVDK